MDCLLLVDLQNDFMPGGALAVPKGDEVIAVANQLATRFEFVVASKDWHPPQHHSFASEHRGRRPGETIQLRGVTQVLWPDHCVQGTHGAEFHQGLDQGQVSEVVQKGTALDIDSYSAFFDNARLRSTGLGERLRERKVGTIYLLGLATDYCVKFSALDAASLGFKVKVVPEGCRGIDLNAGDVQRAWDELRAAGVEIVAAGEIG